MLGLIILVWVLFAAFSLVSLWRPIWPYQSRGQVMTLGPLGLIFGLMMMSANVARSPGADPESSANTQSSKQQQFEQPSVSTVKIKPTLPGVWLGNISRWGWPDDIIRANDALTTHYLRTGRYSPVDCHNKHVQGLIYIRCRSTGSNVVGAIYIVTNSVGSLAILPANGKAKGQTGDRDAFADADNRLIRVIQKSDDAYLKILTNQPLSAAIDEFQKGS